MHGTGHWTGINNNSKVHFYNNFIFQTFFLWKNNFIVKNAIEK